MVFRNFKRKDKFHFVENISAKTVALSKTTRLILLDSLLQETVHVVPSLYLQEPTGKTKIKMAEIRME